MLELDEGIDYGLLLILFCAVGYFVIRIFC